MKKILFFFVLLAVTSRSQSYMKVNNSQKKSSATQSATWELQQGLFQNITSSWEGNSVSLSADGTILAAGAPYTNGTGATQIYTSIDGTWSHQTT